MHESPSESLLSHASWLRALARELTRGAGGDADDLSQDAWVAALRQPEGPFDRPRSWWRAVLQNLQRQDRRSSARRRQREERTGEVQHEEPVVETLERAALGRELYDAVLALDEPYRTAIFLRYYEDLQPREIARKLDVPLATVKSRLARGLERLRARWRERHGEERWALVLGLVAEAELPAPAPSLLLAGIAMQTKIALAAVLAGVGLVLVWQLSSDPSPGETARGELAASPSSNALDARPAPSAGLQHIDALDTGSRSERTTTVPAQASGTPLETFEAIAHVATTRTIEGTVYDTEVRPLAGVRVNCRAQGRLFEATSDADGRFVMTVPEKDVTIEAEGDEWVTLVAGFVRRRTEVDPIVVVAPFRTLAGSVVDEHDSGLAGARVRFFPPRDLLRRFEQVLDASEMREWHTGSDMTGRFTFERAPMVEGAELLAELEGYVPARLDAPLRDDFGVVLRMERETHEGITVRGRVLDPRGTRDGAPMRAHVSAGAWAVVTDPRGEFEIQVEADHDRLMAAAPGRLPATFTPEKDPASGEVLWPEYVFLELGDEPLTLRGVVVDGENAPRPHVQIWIADPTLFGVLLEDVHAQLENFLLLEEEDYADGLLDETYFRSITTDAEGRFEIEGLLDREYHLEALHLPTMESQRGGPYRPGPEDVRFVFPRPELRPLRGRITTSSGRPVENAKVALMAPAFGGISFTSQDTLSDEEGRFAFEAIGNAQARLWIRGDDILPTSESVGPLDEELEITAEARCHFQVDLGATPERANGFRMFDADGEHLQLQSIAPHGVTRMDQGSLNQGTSDNLCVSDRAATLVLYKDGVEVGRSSVQLESEELVVLRP